MGFLVFRHEQETEGEGGLIVGLSTSQGNLDGFEEGVGRAKMLA